MNKDARATEEALTHLDHLCEFAYAQGFHELGYDPIKVIRAVLANPPNDAGGASVHNQEKHMQPHQQRVVDEKAALDELLSKLNAFHGTATFAGLDAAEQDRLTRQSVAMDDYSKILAERIAAF